MSNPFVPLGKMPISVELFGVKMHQPTHHRQDRLRARKQRCYCLKSTYLTQGP